ncbi:hypothetical protein ACI797_09940 [Geodermatophilus sp. SYSU D00691]
MTVVETILVYVVAPLAVIAVLAVLTLVPGRRKRPRYKPGQSWEHTPVWYEPHPEATGIGGGHGDGHGVPAFGAAVSGGETKAIGSSLYGEPASGAGHSAGASAAAAPAPANVGGPRGGARGTW